MSSDDDLLETEEFRQKLDMTKLNKEIEDL